MRTYSEWSELARRWSSCVDYASPMTAWTSQMFALLKAADGDRTAATKMLFEIRKKENDAHLRTLVR